MARIKVPEAFNYFFEPLTGQYRYRAAAGGRGSGKCLKIGTKVLMYDGSRQAVETIRVGQQVMGPDSRPRNVLSITSGFGPLYRVKQKQAQDYVVNESHILHLKKYVGEGRYPQYGEFVNMNVLEFKNSSNRFKDRFHGYKSGPIEFANKQPLYIPPYILGVWLGDGTAKTQQITSMDEEIIAEYQAWAHSLGLNLYRTRKPGQKAFTVSGTVANGSGDPNIILGLLRGENLLGNKHVPFKYQTASIEDRLELLAGFIDTDGNLAGNCYHISQKREGLIRQIKFVADSLGFKTSLRAKTATCKGKKFPVFKLSIFGDVNKIPCRLLRKQIKTINKNKDWRKSRLDVEFDGLGEFFGFELSGDHLFLLEDGTITHNSTSIATALVAKASIRPLTILCCREVQRSIKDSVKRLIDNRIDDLGLRGKFESTLTEVRSSVGGRFLFEGLRSNIDNVKSLEGVDICWVEEAQTISQTSIDTLIPTIRKPNSELWFSWNPRFKNDPVDVMFRGDSGAPPKTKFDLVNYDRNPFFPEVLRDEMEWDKKRNPDKYAHVWLGEYLTHSEARVFKNWSVEPFETPAKVDRFYFGADWGFSVDPTTLIRCFIQGRKLFVDYEAYRVGCPIEATPALFRTIPGAMAWPIVADSARPETISYMRTYGFKMFPAKKGEGSVEDGVEFLKNYDIVVHPRCKHTIDELSMYSYRIDKLTNEILPVLEDSNNHCLDALRYSIEALRRLQAAVIASPIIVTTPYANFGERQQTNPAIKRIA